MALSVSTDLCHHSPCRHVRRTLCLSPWSETSTRGGVSPLHVWDTHDLSPDVVSYSLVPGKFLCRSCTRPVSHPSAEVRRVACHHRYPKFGSDVPGGAPTGWRDVGRRGEGYRRLCRDDYTPTKVHKESRRM